LLQLLTMLPRIPDLLERQAADWAGGRSIDELLAAIERAGAAEFASKARVAFDR